MIGAVPVLILCSVYHVFAWSFRPPLHLGAMSSTTTKYWTKKSSPNWRDWNSRVTLGDINFPTNLEAPLAFQTAENSKCEIVLPMDDIISEDELAMGIQDSTPTCPMDAGTLPEDNILWINPDNWTPNADGSINEAVPHIERLPCTNDVVRFSRDLEDFVVLLPNRNITIQRMTYDGTVLSRYNFKSNTKKENFIKHFVVRGELDVTNLINFTGRDCPTLTGCECGTLQFYDDVCNLMKPKCAKNLPCPNPIQPLGHCCPICATYLLLYFDPERFIFWKFYPIATKKLSESDSIVYYIGKISDTSLHIVLVGAEDAENEVYKIAKEFADYIKNFEHLAVLDVTVTSSGSIYDPNTWFKSLRIILYMLASMGVLMTGFFLYNTKNTQILKFFSGTSSSSFFKFENIDEDEQKLTAESDNDKQETSNEDNCAEAEISSEGKSDSETFVELPLATLSETEDIEDAPKSHSAETGVLLDISDTT